MQKLHRITLCCFIGLFLSCNALYAEPRVKISSTAVTLSEGITDAMLDEIAKAQFEGEPSFSLRDVHSPEDMAKLCAAFPQMTALEISSDELSSIEPLAALKNLTSLEISADSLKDFSPLAGLTKIRELKIESEAMGPDLKWMRDMTQIEKVSISGGDSLVSLEGIPALPNLRQAEFCEAPIGDLAPIAVLTNLKELKLSDCKLPDLTPLTALAQLEKVSFYGSRVKDFSPLAKCPGLKKLDYYGTTGAEYSTLGKLTQLEVLEGGLTNLEDISWISNLSNLKSFNVFSEKVTDYTPLTAIQLENFEIWSMKVPVGDLGFLSKMTSLNELTLKEIHGATNLEALGGLENLKTLELIKINVDGGETIPLAALKKLPQLSWLTLSEGIFTEEELTGFANPDLSISQR